MNKLTDFGRKPGIEKPLHDPKFFVFLLNFDAEGEHFERFQ
jgi:hypothetical protein